MLQFAAWICFVGPIAKDGSNYADAQITHSGHHFNYSFFT